MTYYYGRDPRSRSLKHFKYISKKKVNGKWRYYYDTKKLKKDVKNVLGYDEKAAMDKADANYIGAKGDAGRALDNYHGYQLYLGNKYYKGPY